MARYAALGGKIDQEGGLKFLLHLFRQGYSYGWNVSQRGAGANMSVDVAVGGGMIATSANVPYYGWSDAVENVAVTTSNPSNPRIDTIVAFINLAAISSASTNNPNALVFQVVAGTAAASPTAPSGATIQSAIGAGNPYVILANIAVATSAATIVNANITDLRAPMAFSGGYIWGGASNTKGHLVPNFADDTLLLAAAAQTITGKTIGSEQLSNPYKFSVYRAAALTSASSLTAVAYDTKSYDTGSNVDVVTNKGRFTAPIAGTYHFTGYAGNTAAGGTTILSCLYKNGAVVKQGSFAGTNTTGGAYSVVSGELQLAASDYVEVYFIGGGGSVMGVGADKCYFDGFLVSRT